MSERPEERRASRINRICAIDTSGGCGLGSPGGRSAAGCRVLRRQRLVSRRSVRRPVAAGPEIGTEQVDKGWARRDSEASTFGSRQRQENRPCEKTGTRNAAEPRLTGESEAPDRAGPLTLSRPTPCWAMENVDARRPDQGLRGTAPSRPGRAPFRGEPQTVRCSRSLGSRSGRQASGTSCPSPSTSQRRAPGIPSARARACSTGNTGSAVPWTTSVGTVISPRLSRRDSEAPTAGPWPDSGYQQRSTSSSATDLDASSSNG